MKELCHREKYTAFGCHFAPLGFCLEHIRLTLHSYRYSRWMVIVQCKSCGKLLHFIISTVLNQWGREWGSLLWVCLSLWAASHKMTSSPGTLSLLLPQDSPHCLPPAGENDTDPNTHTTVYECTKWYTTHIYMHIYSTIKKLDETMRPRSSSLNTFVNKCEKALV